MAREFKINNVVVDVLSDWNGTDAINARSLFAFTVIDKKTLSSIDNGDSVEIYNGGVKIFGGLISTINNYEGEPNKVYHAVNAVDYSALADRRLVVDVIEDKMAGWIVTNVILPILAEEGVVAGNIQEGVTATKVVFNRIKASSALDQLKTLAGFNWNIDKDRKLNFFDNATNLAPVVINDMSNIYAFNQTKSLDQYRNRQYIRGGKGTTAKQSKEEPTPKPDGVSRKFFVRYPIAEKPEIFINSVAVNPTDIGVNSVDDNKKWYYEVGKDFLIQDRTETPLNTETIEVDYKGLFDLLGFSEDPAQIDQRKAVESGTSGIYESITVEQSITTSDAATQFGEGLLNKYGEIEDKVSFITETPNIEAGQLLPIQKSLFGINDNFLIESVNISPIGDGVEYQVIGLDGAALGGWEVFFKDLISGGGQFAINENEVVIFINNMTETDKNQGSFDIIITEPFKCGTKKIAIGLKIGGDITQEVTVND